MVVALEEVIQARLLLEVLGGGFGGFFLEAQVHALMAAILLGMTGFDALDVDSQTQPPHPPLTQAKIPLRR